MSRTSMWMAVSVTVAGLAVLGGLSAIKAAPALKGPAGGDWPGPNPSIYLGCGESGGRGTVVQFDWAGNVLGTIELSDTPYGLAADRNGLVAALPSRNAGKVVRIDRAGKIETLMEDATRLPAPIAVAADPGTGDILIADNVTDVILHLPAGKPKEARQVLAIKGHEGHCQDMSVAFAADGQVLFGGTGPVGVYRFADGAAAALGDPILKERGAVAADPRSKRWAAATVDKLRLFEGTRQVAEIPYPAGRKLWHETLAIGPGGAPVVVLHLGGNRFEVVQADPERKEFRTLFSWDKSRVVTLAIGPKLLWK